MDSSPRSIPLTPDCSPLFNPFMGRYLTFSAVVLGIAFAMTAWLDARTARPSHTLRSSSTQVLKDSGRFTAPGGVGEHQS